MQKKQKSSHKHQQENTFRQKKQRSGVITTHSKNSNNNENDTKIVYLDNNATTFMPKFVINHMISWMNKGNPSSSYDSSVRCKEKIQEAKKDIAKYCNIGDDYYIILNSGATEGNANILRSAMEGYRCKMKIKPHLIISAIEHKSILETAKNLESLGEIFLTLIQPDILGFIHPHDVEHEIRNNTALISIMAANNETGTINNIKAIGEIAHKHNVPFHTDYTQLFGKKPAQPNKENIDAFTMSFHKLHGPPGIGALVIKKDFWEGFGMKPLIAGTQNDGMRGGTECMPNIAGAHAALLYTLHNRYEKNQELLRKKIFLLNELKKHIPCKTIEQYWKEKEFNLYRNVVEVVFISGDLDNIDKYLYNTIMLSVVKRTKPYICNIFIKKMLEKKGIIVSIGSACNTQSKNASHVVEAMRFDDLLKKGVLRISMCDDTTIDDLKKFILNFLMIIKFCVNTKFDPESY